MSKTSKSSRSSQENDPDGHAAQSHAKSSAKSLLADGGTSSSSSWARENSYERQKSYTDRLTGIFTSQTFLNQKNTHILSQSSHLSTSHVSKHSWGEAAAGEVA